MLYAFKCDTIGIFFVYLLHDTMYKQGSQTDNDEDADFPNILAIYKVYKGRPRSNKANSV